MRNCVKRNKYGSKSRTNLLLLLCAYVPPPMFKYVVTCKLHICVILFAADPDPNLRGPTSLPTCLLLTHVALCQRVRSVITMTRYINVLTYLLTVINSTIGCTNFGPDWPLLFKLHEI